MKYIIGFEEKDTDGKVVDADIIEIYEATNEAMAISLAVDTLRQQAEKNGSEITIKYIETRQAVNIPIKKFF